MSSTPWIAPIYVYVCRFTKTKKQSPTIGARANNTLHKYLGSPDSPVQESAPRVASLG